MSGDCGEGKKRKEGEEHDVVEGEKIMEEGIFVHCIFSVSSLVVKSYTQCTISNSFISVRHFYLLHITRIK